MNEETDFSASDLKTLDHTTFNRKLEMIDSKDNTLPQIFYFLKYI